MYVKKISWMFLSELDEDIVKVALHYDIVYDFIMKHSTNDNLKNTLQCFR